MIRGQTVATRQEKPSRRANVCLTANICYPVQARTFTTKKNLKAALSCLDQAVTDAHDDGLASEDRRHVALQAADVGGRREALLSHQVHPARAAPTRNLFFDMSRRLIDTIVRIAS